jgi:predicted AlkP superfamily phosphohydrolase/phosphomutase
LAQTNEKEIQRVSKRNRVAIIGFDAVVVPLLMQAVEEGHLPNIKKIMDGGTLAENALVAFPTITPPNWTTLATGAKVGTHQIIDFWLLTEGKTPDNANLFQCMNSNYTQAQTIWEAADAVGKKSVVLNWPSSWPSRMKNGIMIGGHALTPHEIAYKKQDYAMSACGNQVLTTGVYPGAVRGKFETAEDWENVDELGDEPLEMAFPLAFPERDAEPAPTTWWVLARQSEGDDYDTLTLSPSKDFSQAFCTLKVKEWSPKIWTTLKMADGSDRKVFFRCKLVELSADAEEFRLWVTALVDPTKVVSPEGIMDKVVSTEGVPIAECGMREAQMGVIDPDTFVESCNIYSQYLADVAKSLLREGDWDVFCMHSHPPDFTYHLLSVQMDHSNPDPVSRAVAMGQHLSMLKGQDSMLGQILEVLPEDTLVVLTNDHGATTDGQTFDPFKALIPAGLANLFETPDPSKMTPTERFYFRKGVLPLKVDNAHSKALPAGTCYIYVHLKDKYPEGIVEQADYETVQQQIIDCLYQYVDPETGKRPVALALAKQDARMLGLYGERVPDVVYALYPWFDGQHGLMLPSARWNEWSLQNLWVFNGPGVKKGQRITRTVGIEDIVPTACYLTGLPFPKDMDGAVITQVMEEPNSKHMGS